MNKKIAFSLLNLPFFGFDSLLSFANKEINRSLASSIYTPQVIIDKLAESKDISTATKALRRASDVDLLKFHAEKNSVKSIASLWNKLTPSYLLENKVKNGNRTEKLVSLLNPSLDKSFRDSYLTPSLVDEITNVGGSLGEGVIRATELVLTTDKFFQDPDKWSNLIKRAITYHPDCSAEVFDKIESSGFSNWKSSRNHPSRSNLDIYTLTLNQLINVRSSATDLLASIHQELNAESALEILNNDIYDVEPHVASRLVERFGIEIFSKTKPIAGTRVTSTAFKTPMMEFYRIVRALEISDYKKAIQPLSEASKDLWYEYFQMLEQWEQSPRELSFAVLKI